MNKIELYKILSYYNSMVASLHFYSFLYDEKFDREDASILNNICKNNYNKVIVIQCALMLSLYKDKYLVKNNLNINETGLNLLLEPIIGVNKTKEEKIDYLNTLRHKLLHGDYSIPEDEVILYDFGKEIRIPINKLYDCCSSMFMASATLKKEKNSRNIICFKPTIIQKCGKIKSTKNLKRIIEEYYIISFTDEPEDGYERDYEYACVLERFYREIKIYKKCDISIERRIDLILKNFEKDFKKQHIKLEYNISKSQNREVFQKIKTVYLENKSMFDELDIMQQYNAISNFIYTYTEKEKENLFFAALLNNTNLLKTYLESENSDISKIEYKKFSAFYSDDMTIASAIGAFYSTYQYGLESILSKNLSLQNIVDGNVFDFSLLDMGIADDPNMDKTLNLKRFEDEKKRMFNDITSSINDVINSYNKYSNYIEKAKEKTYDAEIRILQDLKIKTETYRKAKNDYQKANLFLKTKFDLFAKNYNIISHIRNAISHGNVIIYPHEIGDTVNDRYIEFNDIHEGRSTYKIKLKFIDFIKLLNKNNIDTVLNYLTEEVKPIVDSYIEYQQYLEEVNEKSLVKKIINKIKKYCGK